MLRSTRLLFIWCTGIGLVSTVLYLFAGEPLLRVMTSNYEVIAAARPFLPWLLVMPVISCIAFMWDGIFIGATAAKALRDSMIFSVIGFFATYGLLAGVWGVHALWAGYMMHLLVRTVAMTLYAPKKVFGVR